MLFDPDNKMVKLCAEGISLEAEKEKAMLLYQQAKNEATNALEKFIAAHYMARVQQSVNDKLRWDKISLEMALKVEDPSIKSTYPSLYLNIAKCYEDLNDLSNAKEHYEIALSKSVYLIDDGYSQMIKKGIRNGLERLKTHS